MGKGSIIVPVRIPQDLLTLLDGTIKRVNAVRAGIPYERSSFIRQAIADKISHYARSSRKAKKARVK